ncbi:hypothetical protein HNO88_003894 [Novosphingobium chloroacetimidivorans]|uniref:Uncharacterized protein n=1 Tax=Novosphingobium chloroacetimidivorans TaxID=1428314 RepID=A0A7W7KDP3_9SPHN|nr:hypothetical protein [Novosphingobium chloroacetimidivorans]MBB4860550.1 hypothetical protein [Novosphingobium chloroacetimidivorans]
MDETDDGFEQAARIVEAYAEAEGDERVLDLLADIARDIRARALND